MPTIITATRLRQQTTAMAQLGESEQISEVWDVDVNSLSADSHDVQADILAPAIIRTRHLLHSDYVCTRVTVRQITVGVWQLDAEFTSRVSSADYCKISRRSGTRNMMVWKYTPGTVPTNGTTTWPPTTSVTGTGQDVFGEPRPVMVGYNDISIEVYYDRSHYAAPCFTNNAFYWPDIWTAALNKRNSVAFLGFDIGKVVFLGFSEQLTEDPWVTATLSFRADQLYHLEQRVLPDVDGHVLLGATSTWDTSPIMQATKAYWFQPYSATPMDFSQLHSGFFSELVTPTPAYPC